MSQTTQSSRPGSQGGRPGGYGGRPGGYGGRPGGQGDRPRRPRREPVVIPWVPKTILGKKVDSGEITKMEITPNSNINKPKFPEDKNPLIDQLSNK